jgi:KilA-N domain
MEATQIFEYQEKQIEFDLPKLNMMINATEMGKVFGKRVDNFMANEATKLFIEAIKLPDISGSLGIKSDEDIYQMRGRNGVWMHRVLALKFAAWLDPKFEAWVFVTIERMLFGTIKDTITAKMSVDEQRALLHQHLLETEPRYVELLGLEASLNSINKRIKAEQMKQLNIFKTKPNDN